MQGVNTTFYQNKRKGKHASTNTVAPINCEVVYKVEGEWKRFRFATGEKCAIKHFKSQRVYHTVNFASQINDRLKAIEARVEEIYNDSLMQKRLPQPEKFKSLILSEKQKVKLERDFLTDYLAFMEYHEAKGTTKSSFTHIKNLHKHLSTFSRKQKVALSYESINLDFYGKFLKYLRHYQFAPDQTYTDNTVGNYIKKLKMFLNWAKGNGWNSFEYYHHPDFKILDQPVENIYLEREEVKALASLDLSKRPALNLTRNWFVLACETGMRYNDYKQLTKSNIKEVANGYDFTYVPNKTRKSSKIRVTVPLSLDALRILLQYGFEMPKPISNQKMNKALKELAELAGIKKDVATHTARRTFATLAYKDNHPVFDIMKITGHRTEKEFYKYLCIEGEENSARFRQNNERYQVNTPGLLENHLRIA
jgi:integrase